MASQQAFQQYAQTNKGTLQPGQSIAVNKYTVVVERYLSQGGFAHVYLVRTATPVYNTTHHVLKRIAVSSEAMLSEVKKEVDIMRLLKGHPNIVHLIDAAWHRMSNGLYEVFILMEFCAGGGIIDMMNRRLRERLTEAEILQIFVDVCEGVACMHNIKPALLHRDLKVENILQSSSTSFKLCDFGSAVAVAPRPPSSMQEVRALEADLNRHTTLQYRAPEMVDPYLRRPVDEKSDVWALGVLLYKLCYYTTPFEEHGPLAILNVQYRIPPYPVYSPQMNSLIASMLREHGSHRPSVFELLTQVHDLRGTKSQFKYQPPVPQPLSPRKPSGNVENKSSPKAPQMSVKMSVTPISSSPRNAGVQAREKVLEAIEPMRRGRPTPSKDSTSRSSSPHGPADQSKSWMEPGFGAEGEKVWKETLKDSGPSKHRGAVDDPWNVQRPVKSPTNGKQAGFGDDFGQKLWDSFDGAQGVGATNGTQVSNPVRPPALTGSSALGRNKDAFEGLGVTSPNKHTPTLGEARKLRTGLAMMSNGQHGNTPSYSTRTQPLTSPSGVSQSTPQTLGVIPAPLRPSGSGSSWSSQPPGSRPGSSMQDIGAESRFPSLEELDAKFGSPDERPVKQAQHTLVPPPSDSTHKPRMASPMGGSSSSQQRPQLQTRGSHDGRSDMTLNDSQSTSRKSTTISQASSSSRPSLVRKHRSSVSIKPTPPNGPDMSTTSKGHDSTPKAQPQQGTHDWLTGEATLSTPTRSTFLSNPKPSPALIDVPIMRESPSKRASFSERSDPSIPQPSFASVGHPSPPSQASTNAVSPTVERFTRAFPALDVDDSATLVEPPKASKPAAVHKPIYNEPESASSADEGPEEASGYMPSNVKAESKRPKRKGRQSSVHDLVDLWGGGGLSSPTKEKDSGMRSAVTPMHKPADLNKPHRRSTTMALAQPRAGSPDSLLSPPQSAKRQTHSRHSSSSTSSKAPAHTPSPGATSPTSPSSSSRSRPQSMFLFPAKSPEVGAPLSAGLVPPENPNPRPARRTSISDMVQRYEAIGLPKVATKPPQTIQTSDSREVLPAKVRNGPSLPPTDDGSSYKSRALPNGFNAPSPIGQSQSLPPFGEDTPRQRRTSLRPHAPTAVFPMKRPSLTEDSRGGDARSPSPERPYQGVGKLIDQWQRKTADAEPARPVPKRGGFVAKRAGLVTGEGADRGQ